MNKIDMDYQQWLQLFGRASNDADVAMAIATAGISKPLVIGPDELTVAADLPGKGITIVFTDESIIKPEIGQIGRPILSSIMMLLYHPSEQNIYKGIVPYGLSYQTSQAYMWQRFGAPIESGEGRPWDIFLVDGLELSATYSRDLLSITRLTVRLPGGR